MDVMAKVRLFAIIFNYDSHMETKFEKFLPIEEIAKIAVKIHNYGKESRINLAF